MLKRQSYETDRLLLKVLSTGQGGMLRDYYNKNKDFLAPYEASKKEAFFTRDYQELALKYDQKMSEEGRQVRLWIFLKSDPQVPIGSIALSHIIRGAFQSCILGYKLDKDHVKKGYMKEAVERVINIAFCELDLHRIEAHVMLDNQASLKVLKANGFQMEGMGKSYLKINGQWEDHYHLAIIKN